MLAAAPGELPPFSPAVLVTKAEFEPLPLLAILAVGGAYLYGVLLLRRRGDAWPAGRTISFVGLGLTTLAVALLSGLAAYDTTSFGAHMAQHMLLSMVAPILLALGAPVTLALRTFRARPRAALLAVLHSRLARLVSFPMIGWVLFVASPFALYFSGWYEATLENAWLHVALHAHFLFIGCLFFWPLLGTDPVPGRVPYPARMLLAAATLPLHAFLGVAIMSGRPDGSGLIAADHYLAFQSVEESVFQQDVGGGLLWASGDLVGLLFVFTMLYQWMRASEREAAREDRRLDREEQIARLRTQASG